MTEEQIKQRAREKSKELEENQTIGIYDDDESLAYDKGYNSGEVTGYEKGYIAGATENGIQWHDLRKDPNDLPPRLDEHCSCSDSYYVQYGGKYGSTDFAYYNFIENKWQRYEDAENVKGDIIAWCEIPLFKE